MVSAQEYLDQNYPKEERGSITELDIKNKKLEGHLDLSDFVNLKGLYCEDNKLTSLDLRNNTELEELIVVDNQLINIDLTRNTKLEWVTCFYNKISVDLSTFSHLTKLTKLDLGLEPKYFNSEHNENNNFYGSLKALENCKQLEYICIGLQPNIKGGLECLPAEKITYFGCHETEFEEILRPYDYDVYAWQLVNVEPKFNHANLLSKIENTKSELANPNPDWKEKKITRLQSKLQKLEEKLKSLEQIKNELEIVKSEEEQLEELMKKLEELKTPITNPAWKEMEKELISRYSSHFNAIIYKRDGEINKLKEEIRNKGNTESELAAKQLEISNLKKQLANKKKSEPDIKKEENKNISSYFSQIKEYGKKVYDEKPKEVKIAGLVILTLLSLWIIKKVFTRKKPLKANPTPAESKKEVNANSDKEISTNKPTNL